MALWWSDNDAMAPFAPAAALLSFLWLLAQSLFMLDVAHDLHELFSARIAAAAAEDADQ
jgi:hypothetical protein